MWRQPVIGRAYAGALAVAAMLLLPAAARADEGQSDTVAREAAMRGIVKRLELMVVNAEGERSRKASLIEQPLLKFADADGRGMLAALLWAWTAGGRPVAAMESYILREDPDRCFLSIVSTSDAPLAATLDGRLVWQPAGGQFQTAPAPLTSKMQRIQTAASHSLDALVM